MKKVSIAVIGCGRIGQMHAKNIQLHEQTNLVCFYDTNEEFAKKVSNAPKVVKSGTAKTKSEKFAIKRNEGIKRLKKSGSLRDAAAIFRQNLK